MKTKSNLTKIFSIFQFTGIDKELTNKQMK
jgi:hypothetical protein